MVSDQDLKLAQVAYHAFHTVKANNSVQGIVPFWQSAEGLGWIAAGKAVEQHLKEMEALENNHG